MKLKYVITQIVTQKYLLLCQRNLLKISRCDFLKYLVRVQLLTEAIFNDKMFTGNITSFMDIHHSSFFICYISNHQQ